VSTARNGPSLSHLLPVLLALLHKKRVSLTGALSMFISRGGGPALFRHAPSKLFRGSPPTTSASSRHKAQGTRHKEQGTRHKGQGTEVQGQDRRYQIQVQCTKKQVRGTQKEPIGSCSFQSDADARYPPAITDPPEGAKTALVCLVSPYPKHPTQWRSGKKRRRRGGSLQNISVCCVSA
jgi:hypothetical protein